MDDQVEATRDSIDDVKDKTELVRLWLDALALSDKEGEEDWRKCAEKTVKIYRQQGDVDVSDSSAGDKKFNILHANVETLLPALYNSTPIPDVRRRFNDDDKVGKAVSDLLERCISHSVDSYDFDQVMRFGASDMELTGRAVARVRYLPYMSQDESSVDYEEVVCEHVPWKSFRRGPGRTWADVPWIAFKLFLTRDELEKLTPKLVNEVKLDSAIGGPDKGDGQNPKEVFKRAKVWEIWDKESQEVLFIADSYKKAPIRQEPDPLKLTGFFPIPRPMMAIETSDTLVPVVPYEIYKDQAEELERVSQRIMALTEAIKSRGIYDGRAKEIERLSEAEDNVLIGVENATVYAEGGGLEKAIAWWPLETAVTALKQLYESREQIKATIYEITGIADILRGNTDPNETLGAQQLKAQWGSLRIQRKQAEIQRYARDLFRLKAEIIAAKFQWKTITMISGVDFPPQAVKQQAQQAVQQMQQQAQGKPMPKLPSQLTDILEKPSQEEVEQLLRNDAMRGFRVDVESDSTIRADLTRNQQNMNLFLQGTSQFAAAMGPILIAPQFQALTPAVLEIYSAFARNFKLGKQAEDALDKVAEEGRKVAENPPPPKPDPAMQLEQMKAQALQQKTQMDMQAAQAKHEMDAKAAQEKHQMEMAKMQAELEVKAQELELKKEELALKEREMHMQMQVKQQGMMMDQQKQHMDMQHSEREHELGMEATETKHELGMEAMAAKAKAAKAKPKAGARA